MSVFARSRTPWKTAVIAFVLSPAAPAVGDGGYHRFYFDQQMPLDLDLTRVAVYQDLDADPPPPPLGPVLAAHGIEPTTIAPLGFLGWVTAEPPPWVQTAADMEMLAAQLAKDEGLDFAGPVFLDAEQEPLVPMPDILLRFEEGVSQADQQETIDASGAGTVLDQVWGGMERAWRLRNESGDGFVTLQAANELALLETVYWCEPDFIKVDEMHDLPDDTRFVDQWRDLNYGQQSGWAQDADMDTAEAWTVTSGDSSVGVAVLDLGTQLAHPDLNVEPGVDIYTHYPIFDGNGNPVNTCDNHGTPVAGVISAINDNGLGVTGVAPDCVSVPVRIGAARVSTCDDDNAFWSSDGVKTYGLFWAAVAGYTITNNSWSSCTPSSAVEDAFVTYRAAGMLHFAATGNDGASSIDWPASIVDVIAVGSTSADNSISSFSNTGSGIDVVAPGEDIWMTDRTGSNGYADADYVLDCGTSFACPAAAGVAALVWSAVPSLTADEVEEILKYTATDLGETGYDTSYGWGLVNAHQAVMEALGWIGSDRSFIISEIRKHDPASPDQEEYVELYNTSSSAEELNHVSYAVIGDDASDNDGVIDESFELNPWWEWLDGFDRWTIATDSFTIGVADQTTTLAFENGDNVTHMLLLHGALSEGCDVDLNDDGVLDYTPWLKVLDWVSVLEDSGSTPSSSEWWYAGDTVGPNGLGDSPGHVYRCNNIGEWQIGPADPAIGDDTPDAANPSCSDFVFAGLIHGFIESIGELTGGPLEIIGGAGSDAYGATVHIPFGDFLCLEMGDLQPGLMANGASVDGTATGAIGGDPGLVITRLHATIAGTGMELSAEFPHAASSLQDITLLDDGAVVGELLGLDQPIIVVGGPILEPPILEFAPKPDELPSPPEAGGTFTFAHDVPVTVVGPAGALTADRVVVRPSSTLSYDHIGLVNVIASGTPSFSIAGELVGKHGHAHRALGAGRFVIGPEAIAVEQLGDPQGGDGVAVELAEPAAAFAFDLAPMMVPPPDGAFLDWSTCYVDAAGDPDFCGSSRIADAGAALMLSMTEHVWTDAVVEVYLAGEFQAQAQVPVPGTLATILDETAWPATLDAGAVDNLIYTWSGFAPATIDLPDGPTATGDEIRVMDAGLSAGGGGPLIASVALTGADLERITIIDEQSSEPTPCPEDVDGDGTVGTLDFLALLAAWGPCPGCPEDIDGDGTVGTLDFLALLAAWGPCPT